MKKLLLVSFIFFSLTLFAQKEANFWYFGQNAGLDFTSGTPTVLNDGQLSTLEGCSTISDKDGNLLFYSDGTTVWNKDHQIMRYTSGALANDLRGNPSSTQSALVVPNPENTNLYYIFTVGAFGGASGGPGFNYYTVDISKGSGGEIIGGPIDLSNGLANAWSEKVTAVQGEDCTTIWILSMVRSSIYAYKIDKNGVDTTPVISFVNYNLNDRRGYFKVSPDGTKLAVADYNAGNSGTGFSLGNSNLVLYDFDTKGGGVDPTGIFLVSANTDGAPYGIEFSQQSSKLYVSTHDGTNNKVYQYDITSSDIRGTKTLVHQQTGYRGALQLGPDGKIYATVPVSYPIGTAFLDVINKPDADPADVDYQEDAINLGGPLSTQGLPPFIQSFFAPVNIVDDVTGDVLSSKKQTFCIGESYTLKAGIIEAGATYTWEKGGTVIGNQATLTVDNTNHGSGVYTLKIDLASSCKKTLTGSVEIEFKAKPTVATIPTYEQCDFDANPLDGITTFNLESKESELSGGATNVTVEFFKTTDTSFSTPLTEVGYTNATNPEKLVVRIIDNDSKCSQTGEIELRVNATSLATYPDIQTCELDGNASDPNATSSQGTGNGVYDFDAKINDIIANSSGALSLTTHSFEIYRTANDASLQINRIVAPYNDDLFTNNSDVFIRISNKGANACESVGRFKIFVRALPIPQGNPNPTLLCLSNPVSIPQNVTVDLNANTGVAGDTYRWYVDGTLIPGSNGAIHKANKKGTYKVEALRNYPGLSTPCIGYNTFTVTESNKALVVGIDSQDDNDNPNENKITVTVKGLGNYEFAINSTSLTDFKKDTDNFVYTFTDIPPGLNVIYIRDRNGCGITQTREISSIYFQRHFTPNNDGDFDTWKVLGTDNSFYRSAKIQIFDRYGKLLVVIDQKLRNGWDGTYNGKKLPSNDYWYNAILIDANGNVRKKTGHFSLLRK